MARHGAAPWIIVAAAASQAGFAYQSAPGLATGGNGSLTLETMEHTAFQSAPGLATGGNDGLWQLIIWYTTFQSAPGLATGETRTS